MRSRALKILAAAVMLLLPLPLMMLADAAAFRNINILRYIVYFALSVIPITGGYLLCTLRRAQVSPKKVFGVNILIAAGAVLLFVLWLIFIPVAGSIGAGDKFNGFTLTLGLLPAIMLWYYLGIKLKGTGYSEVYTPVWLGMFIVECFVCVIFATVQQEDIEVMSVCRTAAAYQLIITAMLTVLLINQANIDTQVGRRKSISLIVPRGLRKFNAGLIGVVCGAALLLLLLKDPIASGLRWLAVTTGRLIDDLLNNIKMYSAPAQQGDNTLELGSLFSMDGQGRDYLIYIVLVIAVVAVILLRKKIVALFKAVAAKLFGKFSVVENTMQEENYADRYEHISQRTEREIKQSPSALLKDYKREKDPKTKYRIGYRLYLMWLNKHSRRLTPSFTVEQQTDEAKQVYMGQCDIEEISGQYSRLRYSDAEPKAGDKMNSLIEDLYR